MHRFLTKLTLIIILFFAAAPLAALSQNLPEYETISTAQGLSQGMIFDLLQDKEGFIWVATKNGLNRYDGYNFKIFTNDPYNKFTLSGNTVLVLTEDSKGNIWVGTENEGINIYNKKNGQFHQIVNDQTVASSLSGNAIKAMTELPDGRMIVATKASGINLVKLSTDFFNNSKPPVITRLTLPNNTSVYGMGRDAKGNVWIGGMDRNVYQFIPSKNIFVKHEKAELLNTGYFTQGEQILIGKQLFLYDGTSAIPLFDTSKYPPGNILFRPNQTLWDNHHRELSFYDVGNWQPAKPIEWNVRLPTKTRIIYPFIIDRSGILWSGSVGYGLHKYNINSNKVSKTYLPGYSVRWIVPASSNDIFVADHAYGWKRLLTERVVDSPFRNIPEVTEIDNFIIAKNGDYWLKSDDKGYYKYSPETKKLVTIPEVKYYYKEGDKQPMLEDSKGYIWFSGSGGKFTRLNLKTNNIDSFNINITGSKPMLSRAICTALFEDRSGNFWIGTQQGFVKVSFKNGQDAIPTIKWFYNNSNNRNSLNYSYVSSFLDDPYSPNDFLWIGTKGGGLNRLDKKTGDFLHISIKHGLPDNVIYGILADKSGNIWGSTNKGIFCMIGSKNAKAQWTFNNFTKSNGLQDDEFNTGAYARLPNGHLAFGGVKGLNIFDPKKMLEGDFVPNVFITDIQINNQPVVSGDKAGVLKQAIEHTPAITLNYLQDIITLEFASLDFTAPSQNKYRYQLVGIDEDWVESGTRRSATYLHLPPGNFTFKVQGSNSKGTWSPNITALYITVLPPWWRTWWAYCLYGLIIFSTIRAYFRFTVKKAHLQSLLNLEQIEAKRVRDLDAARTRLYTNITHEFRTPLTVILGMAQQVQKNPTLHLIPGTEMIMRNGRNLLKLINELLDLSKLETGKMQLQIIEGDLIQFIKYVVESYQKLAEAEQKQLHFFTDIDLLHVVYDEEKVRQILSNLLSNALKFTPEKGNIYVHVSNYPNSQQDKETVVVIKIRDTGVGIPKQQFSFIFDRFSQLDNGHTRKTEGTGIGLSLTKELVKLMKGEITVKSPPSGNKKGSEFTVKLTFEKSTNSKILKTHPVDRDSDVHFESDANLLLHYTEHKTGPLVLMVEDNADVAAYTASCLEGYRLAIGKDGKEGIELAIDLIPDLIITDVMMPLVDGFELCEQLKTDERTSHIPIIMLTAKANLETKLESLQRGADVYLEKPFNRDELLLRIKKLLELRLKLQNYYSRNFSALHTGVLKKELFANDDIRQKQAIEDEFINKVTQAIEANLTNAEFTVEQLSKLLFMSHSQVHRKLDALTGLSPNKFIRHLRLKKAMELLGKSQMSIASIAQECGYNDAGYFARIFKQEYNVTPLEWRQNNRASADATRDKMS